MLTIDDVKGATILAVDDNPTNLEALSDYLSEFGFTVLLKQDGAKALELTRRKIPDLILLDILMPGMDGFETCQRLKDNPDTRDIPIIFMSALTDTVDKVKGFELGAVDYITKPFQHEELLARVKAHLTIQRLQRDLRNRNTDLQELLDRERKILKDLRLNLSITLPHELRTPLNTILGFAQLLMNRGEQIEPAKILEYAHGIYQGGSRLYRLVENALLYANLKLLRYAPHEKTSWQTDTTVDALPFITSVAQKKVKKAGRSDDLILGLSPASIRVTPDNFEKILLELLDNALKFSEAGTPVHVKTTLNGHLCILSIRDRGHGMTKDQIASVGAYMQFERNRHEQQGTGMGLIICHLLAQLEGGVLSIDSKINQGTSVSIVFNCEHCGSEHVGEQTQPTGQYPIQNPASKAEAELIAPPEDRLAILYELALKADIYGLTEQLDHIETIHTHYHPFIARIRRFADEYRIDLILEYLSKYLPEKYRQHEQY